VEGRGGGVVLGAAWIAEAEQPRPVVEGFAGGVVDGGPEDAGLAAVALHVEEERVAAARKQTEEGRLERPGLQVERRDMAGQVIDRRERQSPRPGNRLRGGEADEQRADQARSPGHRDDLDVVELRV